MTDIYYATVGDAECESFDSDYYYFEELESYIEDEYRELVSEYELGDDDYSETEFESELYF